GDVPARVELAHHHTRDALVDLAVVTGRRAARIGGAARGWVVVHPAVAVVVGTVAARGTVGTGGILSAIVRPVVGLVARTTGIVREIRLSVTIVVRAIRTTGRHTDRRASRRARDAYVPRP